MNRRRSNATRRDAAKLGGASASFMLHVAVRALIWIGIIALALAAYTEHRVLLLAFAGVLFGIVLNTPARWLHETSGLPNGVALAVVVAILAALAAGLGWFLADRIGAQMSQLTEEIPKSLDQLRLYLSQHSWGKLLVREAPKTVTKLTLGEGTAPLATVVSDLIAFIAGALVILFVGLFGAAEPREYEAGLFHLVPPRHRRRLDELLTALTFNLRWWLVGQFCVMLAIGISSYVGLLLIGVPLAMTLAILAGFLEIIPYIGAWLAFVPAVLMASLISPWHMLMVAALYLGLHIFEGYFLGPLIQHRAVLLPPALTLIMQFLLGDLFGFLGLLLAAPFTVCAAVLLKMLYVEDALGDEVRVPGEPGNVMNGR